jgi:SET domain-containing protein
MAFSKKHLVVRRSSIPNSGKGLFTKVNIPAGTRIIEYKGKISTWKEANHDDGRNGYIYYVNRNHVIDALPAKKELARYANDARGLSKRKGLKNNSDYIQDGLRVYIESKKEIPAGSEILVSYGKEYWDVIRYNTRLWKKEEKEKQQKKEHKKAKKKAKRSR